MNNNQISGGGVIYLQNKPSWPLGRAGRSSAECTCAPTGRIRSPPEEHLAHAGSSHGLPVLFCFVLFCLFFFKPRTLQDNVEASSSGNPSLAQAAAFVSALVAGYFREAWPMCLGGVPAHWPGGGGGARCKGIPPPAVRQRERHHTELEAPH